MAEFRYAIFGDPVVRPLPQKASELTWRLSVQTDRVKWLCNPGPFEPEDPRKWQPNEVLLKRRDLVPGTDTPDDTKTPQPIKRVRFIICKSQSQAVEMLRQKPVPGVHFVPSITDPALQALVPADFPQQKMKKCNINYLGFRVDRITPTDRQRIAALLAPSQIRQSAGIPEAWGTHDMDPLDFTSEAAPAPPPPPTTRWKFAYNSANELDNRVGVAITAALELQKPQVETYETYPELVEKVKTDSNIGMFLYNWYIQTPDATPDAWRLLYPLFHSRSIGHTNLTHYDDGESDVRIEAVLTHPATGAATLKTIMQQIPMIVLYHVERLAAWRPSPDVNGLGLRNPDCQPRDRLKAVTVI